MLRRLDRIPGLEGPHAAGLGSPAILNENVVLGTSRDGHELTEAELDAWVATFPIEPMQTGFTRVVLPRHMQGLADPARSEAL